MTLKEKKELLEAVTESLERIRIIEDRIKVLETKQPIINVISTPNTIQPYPSNPWYPPTIC